MYISTYIIIMHTGLPGYALMCLCIHMYMYINMCIHTYTCIHIKLCILQVLACFVQVTPASSLHSTSSSGKSIAEGINDLLTDNHWLAGTEVEAQHVQAMLQETAAQCRTPDTVCPCMHL